MPETTRIGTTATTIIKEALADYASGRDITSKLMLSAATRRALQAYAKGATIEQAVAVGTVIIRGSR